MFKLFDINMDEITFPEGVMPLEIFIGSIGYERHTESVEGMGGVVDYGSTPTNRQVDLYLWMTSKDKMDYRLQRDQLYALFARGNHFYVAESHMPTRVIKVGVDESYIPERHTGEHAEADIICRTLDNVYWESIPTTQQIQMPDYVEGQQPNNNLIPLEAEYWESGAFWLSDGSESDPEDNPNLRTIDHISINGEMNYTFTDESPLTSNVRVATVFEYDSDGGFIKYTRIDRGESSILMTHVDTDTVRVSINAINGEEIVTDSIQTKLEEGIEFTGWDEPTEYPLGYGPSYDSELWSHGMGLDVDPSTHQYTHRAESGVPFNIYNAGNVPIHPFEQYLVIEIEDVEGSTSHFELRNETNGSNFRVTERVLDSQYIKVDGPNVEINNLAGLRRTNKQYIQLSPGDNMLTIHGARRATVRIDARFYYH